MQWTDDEDDEERDMCCGLAGRGGGEREYEQKTQYFQVEGTKGYRIKRDTKLAWKETSHNLLLKTSGWLKKQELGEMAAIAKELPRVWMLNGIWQWDLQLTLPAPTG